MKYRELFDEFKARDKLLESDSLLARRLGVTPGRISQMGSSEQRLSAKQIVTLSNKLATQSAVQALRASIAPVVEHYPILRTESKQSKKWEILRTTKGKDVRNNSIRKVLEESQGIYFFYDSQGKVLYNGKTEKQGLWKEINLAYNRERESHKAFRVPHPVTGEKFIPAWEKPRQPIKRVVYFHEIASYFSAYRIAPELISFVEALIVRSVCNDLSNVRMEKFRFPV